MDEQPNPTTIFKLPLRPVGGVGGFGGLGGLKSRLKKKFIDESFIISDLELKTPTERLREIDSLRMYTPLQIERDTLRIPESIERLNLHLQHHIMLLCGGCAGIRFSSEEMREIISVVGSMETKFQILENKYQELSSTAKKYKKSTMSLTSEVELTGTEGNIQIEGLNNQNVEIRDCQQALQFHEIANEYTEFLRTVQNLVRCKNDCISASSSEIAALLTFEKDPVFSTGPAMPVYQLTSIVLRLHSQKFYYI